ncbi:unnamed protein product [Adineta steineri]|uniref:Uncharacterized protein n=1 Tax=Adineta steineri TaxID=433720 RepID=A0A813QIE8_9BILA|nr:unnamed protein product [Adineta steineri]
MSLTGKYQSHRPQIPFVIPSISSIDLNLTVPKKSLGMDYSSKRQSWLEFINESMIDNTQNPSMDFKIETKESTQINDIHYTFVESDSESQHNITTNFNHPTHFNRSIENINTANKQQQQQKRLTNSKIGLVVGNSAVQNTGQRTR